MDIPSVTPYRNNATTEIQNIDEIPKAIIDKPNPKIVKVIFYQHS